MGIFDDIYNFIKSLSFVDVIFFIAILALLILLVALVYFIKVNKDVLKPNDTYPKDKDLIPKKEEVIEEIKEDLEVIEQPKEYDDEEGELLDLEGLTKKLQEQGERVVCTEYERDQEEKAIISYEELLSKHNKYAINYEKEEVIDDLIVKKVNLNDLINKEEEVKIEGVRVISYQKEEDFLKALKELNRLLN